MAHTRARLVLCAIPMMLLLAPTPAFGAFGDRTLRRGMKGADVKTLQRTLTKLGHATRADGGFGARTERNVKRYETRRRLRIDGVVSRPQARIMRRAVGRAPANTAPRVYRLGERTLRRGSRGADVKALQGVLVKLDLPISMTGTFGAGTESRVRDYERRERLRVDGVVPPSQARGMEQRATVAPSQASVGDEAGHVFPVRGPHNYGGAGSVYGAPRAGHRHQGHDVFAASGTPLVAVFGGKVAWKQYQAGGAGHYLVIHGDDGRDYVYMHLLRPASVAAGQTVTAGQAIGQVGCTGACSGAHLHFELWTPHWYDGGRSYDPLPYLRRWDASG